MIYRYYQGKLSELLKRSKKMDKKNMKNQKNNASVKNNQKKKNIMVISIGSILITAVIIVSVMISIIVNNNVPVKTDNTDKAEVIATGENVDITISEITETAKFYPYTAGDTKMELLALKASDGSIRTAFNTCQVCYGSGQGYYVQDGDVLVCQNCGNRYSADKVGIEKGGCNPIPIMTADRTEKDGTITISVDFINQNKEYFSKWKK